MAINEELNNLAKETWKELPHGKHSVPNGRNVLSTHLVPKIKRDEEGRPTRFNARVVAGGHRQIKRKDYDNVYAPVLSFNIFRLMVILAIKK